MGGDGSGGRYGPKRPVEECFTFSSSWMLQNNYFELVVAQSRYHTITWSNCLGQPVYTVTINLERASTDEMRLYVETTRQVVYLHSTAMRFGGVRWWFRCPGCRRRCTNLHRRPGSVFLCRICHNLTYASCIEGKSTKLWAGMRARLALSVAEVKEGIVEEMGAHNKWRRKRDRRASYKGQGWLLREMQGNNLKLKMLEARAGGISERLPLRIAESDHMMLLLGWCGSDPEVP
jgi:hypothetical protein